MTSTFRTDGGATWLNLLATRGQTFGAHPVERLPDAAAVQEWLTLVGLPPASPVDEGDRARLLALREQLRELALAAVEQRGPDPEAERSVAAATACGAPSLGVGPSPVTVDQAVAAIALSAVVTLRGPDRALLKECAEADCRWVFLDPSGRRRWCPAPACASRGRVRALRSARRAAADDASGRASQP